MKNEKGYDLFTEYRFSCGGMFLGMSYAIQYTEDRKPYIFIEELEDSNEYILISGTAIFENNMWVWDEVDASPPNFSEYFYESSDQDVLDYINANEHPDYFGMLKVRGKE